MNKVDQCGFFSIQKNVRIIIIVIAYFQSFLDLKIDEKLKGECSNF